MPEMPEPSAPPAAPEPLPDRALYQFRFGGASFDEARFELRVAGEVVTVEPRPLRVLAELLHHANEVVTKEELIESVWDGRITVDNVLANAVTKLRKALGEVAGNCIVNVPRVGYRLTGPVERIALQAPQADVPLLQAGLPVPGRPNYRLERALGAGAHGRVWLARHPKTGQERVFKFALDGAGLGALKREYTLARVLRSQLGPRADLVTVHEAHFAEAPFALEAEFVGPDLLAWEAQHGVLARLSIEQRLDLFLQLARTLAAAHGLGVLHRDIKPTNVLVRGESGAWTLVLADFGSGRMVDPEQVRQWGITAMGLTVQQLKPDSTAAGTLMYLAPELQAGGVNTVQSDVYALGVLLYQMVTARLQQAMATGWEREVGDDLLAEDIGAATEGRPERRLASAAALVDRLAALPQRRVQRAAEQAEATRRAADAEAARRRRQRRPWLLAAGLSLSLGLLVSLYAQHEAGQALRLAEEERSRATAIRDFLQRDLLESPDILTLNEVRPATMLNLLQRAAASAGERFKGRPLDEAAVRVRLAESFLLIASLADGHTELTRARQLLAGRVPPDHEDLLIIRFLSAWLAAWTNRFDDARKEIEEAERLAGPARLARPSELAYRAAHARNELSFWRGDYAASLVQVDRLVALADAVFPNTPHRRADARHRKAEMLFFTGRVQESAALEAELTRPPFNSRDMTIEFKVRQAVTEGLRLGESGRWRASADVLRACRDLAVANRQALNGLYLAFAHAHFADALHVLGDFDRAHVEYTTALAQFSRVVGDDHQYVALYEMLLGFNLLAMGQPGAAMVRFDKVKAWRAKSGRALYDRPVELGVAMARTALGQPGEALSLLTRAEPAITAYNCYAGNAMARIRAERGKALLALGRHAEAADDLRFAVAQFEGREGWTWLQRDYTEALRHASDGMRRVASSVSTPLPTARSGAPLRSP